VFTAFETVGGEQCIHVCRGEAAAVRFPAQRGRTSRSASAFPSGVSSDDVGVYVVEDEFAARRAQRCEVGKRRFERRAGEVKADPDPGDNGSLIRRWARRWALNMARRLQYSSTGTCSRFSRRLVAALTKSRDGRAMPCSDPGANFTPLYYTPQQEG
jgi:hypothetical protein